MNLFRNFIFFLFIIFFSSSHSIADDLPNYQREKNIKEQILNFIFDAELIDLKSNLEKNFTLLENVATNSSKSILLLHGRGLSPNEPNVIGPLRLAMSESNINVFSLQLPVLGKGKTYNDYIGILKYSDQRIESALRYIEKETNEIIIIAHSCGVHMIMSWVKNYTNLNIKAFILIGAGATDKGQIIENPFPYNNIGVPILNIYGEHDYGAVKLNSNLFSRYLSESLHPKSLQVEIANSNHHHEDNAKNLVDTVKKWLKLL